jgi:arylsulfatase A-like enzyme
MDERVRGTINGEFTLNIDLAPTLLSAANVEVPAHVQGRDIAALYTGDYATAARHWRKDFFYEFSWSGATIRPTPSSFNSPNPPVFALVSKAYKVRV